MFKPINFIISPAAPAAILLYGIVFGFAMWSHLELQWQRTNTIVIYGVIAVWSLGVIVHRARKISFSFNKLDGLFSAFLVLVLASVAMHWWKGTSQYLALVPFFFILPYLLGRVMARQDLDVFRKILIGMAGALLLLLPFEYVKNKQPGFLYENSAAPLIFGQGHGTMLSGLLFSAALLALMAKLIYPVKYDVVSGGQKKLPLLFDYLLLAAIVSAMVWIASRGPAVAVVVGMVALFFFASFVERKNKIIIVLLFSLFALVAFGISFQNKHHKEYYRLIFVKPSAELSDITPQASRLEYGKPILGDTVCKNIPNSIVDRWVHYRSAWEMFLAKPITGVGANSYGFFSCYGPGWFPHSTILQVLAELGAVGGVLYILLIWFVIRVPIKRYASTADVSLQANMGWLLAYMVLQITTSQFYGNYFLSAGLYFVMGLAASFYDGQSKQDGP